MVARLKDDRLSRRTKTSSSTKPHGASRVKGSHSSDQSSPQVNWRRGLGTCSVDGTAACTGSLAVVHSIVLTSPSAARRANNTRSFTHQLPVVGEHLPLGVMQPLVAVARVDTWYRVS